MSSLSSSPLGIDLVEIKIAKSFYTRHKKDLASFFTRREVSEIKRSKRPYVQMALTLAAKEAMFKARRAGNFRAGMLSFRGIRLGQKGFRVDFVRRKDYVIALAYSKRVK